MSNRKRTTYDEERKRPTRLSMSEQGFVCISNYNV